MFGYLVPVLTALSGSVTVFLNSAKIYNRRCSRQVCAYDFDHIGPTVYVYAA